MDFREFADTYDREGQVILLEGKRKVLPGDEKRLRAIGRFLAENTSHCLFRSGNAAGADQYFSEGVCETAPERLQLILPFKGHRRGFRFPVQSFSLDQIHIASEEKIISQSLANRKTKRLVHRYAAGERDPISMKAAYIIRDTLKVLGFQHLPPAAFALFYDDLNAPGRGGTGHTMQVCRLNDVPYVVNEDYFNWLL